MLPKEMLFVSEYLKDFNGTQAVLRTGAATNVETAATYAHRYLKKPSVRMAIIENCRDVIKRNEIVVDTVLKRLMIHINATPDKFMDDDGAFLPYCEVDDELKPAIKSYQMNTDAAGNETYHYEFYDPHKAIEMLGKHAAMFTDKKETNIGVTGDFARLMAEINGKTRTL